MDAVINTFGLEPMSSTVSGPNVAATLAQYVSPHGTRAFIITDAGVNGAGVVKPITDALTTAGMKWQVFDQVSPNPTDLNVAAGVAAVCAATGQGLRRGCQPVRVRCTDLASTWH